VLQAIGYTTQFYIGKQEKVCNTQKLLMFDIVKVVRDRSMQLLKMGYGLREIIISHVHKLGEYIHKKMSHFRFWCLLHFNSSDYA
jgi:hypothetical protein